MERSIILLVFWTYLRAAFGASLPSDPYYYGGVVEMPFAVSGTPQQRLNENLGNYLTVLGEETAALSDMLIFPESTLNSVEVPTFVPDPKQQIAPCDFADSLSSTPYQSFLVQLSCAARRIATYVVINLTEKENCTTSSLDPRPCATDGLNIFNANVVFDRNGTVISRYRKVNLYEEAKNVTYVPDIAWFDTDFGVRFGHFVCFDILFYTPAEVLVKKYGITDFIMPTMWFSQMPFLTAIQIQQAWAYGNDVKLLVAGATLPSIGSTGSGIYNGRQGYVTAMLSLNEPLLGVNVAQIPKTQNKNQNLEAKLYKQFIRTTNDSAIAEIVTKSNHTAAKSVNQDNIYLKRDFLELYETMPIDLNQGRHFEQTLCFNKTDFCCHFELDWTTIQFLPSDKNHYYTYRLGIFDGWRKEEKADTNKLRNCAIFSCIGDQLADCGKVFPELEEGNIRSAHEFKRVAITGLFPVSTEYLLMPNTLQDDLMPLFVGDIEWTDNLVKTADGPKRNVSLVSKRYMDNLLTFSIYGNYYNGTDLRNSASLSVAHMGVLLMTVLTALAY